MDNSDIIIDLFTNDQGQVFSTSLVEQSKTQSFQNYQMKTNMEEGQDYMLVDKNIYSFWQAKFGSEENELKRFGIVDDSGEAKVELYLKVFNMYAIPNQALFKLDKVDSKKAKNDESFTNPIYISKCETLGNLKKKVQRVLSSHLYFNLKNKSVMI
jgi:hypothetical protein